MQLSTVLFALLSATATLAYPVPRSSSDSDNSASVSVLSASAVDAFHTHALLAQAAYCVNATAALPQIDMLLVGGDGGTLPRFFVGHDPASNTIVVAHEGTLSDNPFSIAIDAQFALAPLNKTFFPTAPDGIETHAGFGETFALTADEILNAVKGAMGATKASTVLVSGHSLGAALATMTSVFLKQHLPASTSIQTTVFGLPRVGNQGWADFVDANLDGLTHVHNAHDLVPTVPPRFLTYQHPSGEVFIDPSLSSPNNVVSCPGQENTNCSEGNDPLEDDIADHKGPYAGVLMGRTHCPVLGSVQAASAV